ncbi:MAG: uracil-xanthine permease [Bacilli bacterium]|nr:uracil-xanthine permease [Bacilli bacterium]
MSANKLIFEVDGKPSFGKLLVFAFQQVLAVLAATIAVPTIIGLPVQIPAAILGAGLGTLVYLVFTKFKSPVVISSSFAFLGALANAVAFGYMGILLGGLFAGLVYVIIAIIIKFAGTRWVEKLMPPVIIGPTVALIGLSLAGAAMGDIVKASASQINGGYNLVGLACGLVTFFTVVILSVQNRFKAGRLLPFILGIAAGYAVAAIFTGIGFAANLDYLKVIDYSPIIENFQNITFESFLTYPRFALLGGIKELSDGAVSADIVAAAAQNGKVAQVITPVGVAEVALAFVPVAFVTFAEHIADHKNLSSIINKDLITEPGLSRTLLGDGVGSMVGTVFGICPNTTYGESVGCVAITKNASVRTIFVAALMLIVLSFLAPVTAALRTIPSCVMGGVCLTLYGFIAVSGLKMFQQVDLNKSKNLFTVAAILISGIGGLAIQIPYAIANNGAVEKTIQITSIATALILGIITMVVTNAVEKRNAPEEE